MKRIICTKSAILILFFQIFTQFIYSQAPEKFSFQAVVRDKHGQLVCNKTIIVRIRILEDYRDGPIVFEEKHEIRSNYSGLLSLIIGEGVIESGDISLIQWDSASYFIDVSFLLPNETEYIGSSVNQILSVPYALYAKNAGNIFSGNYEDLDNLPNIKDTVLRYLAMVNESQVDNERLVANDSIGGLENLITGGEGTLLIYHNQKWDTLSIGNEGDYLHIYNGFPSWESRVPNVEMDAPILTTDNDVIVHGKISYSGTLPIIRKGFCWDSTANPNLESVSTHFAFCNDDFSYRIKNLLSGIRYYVRSFVTTPFQTYYGNSVEVTLPLLEKSCPSTPYVVDYDGNIYNTVQIGSQCWLRENLRSSHYADGTPIKRIATPNYYFIYYDFMSDEELKSYGYLYNWESIMREQLSSEGIPSGVQGICPANWHVPSVAEWELLGNYLSSNLGGSSSIAVALANNEAAWQTIYISNVANTPGNPLSMGFNSSGFSAFATGMYNMIPGKNGDYNTFLYLGSQGRWATTTSQNILSFIHAVLTFSSDTILFYTQNTSYCLSVRCVRD